MLTCTDCEHSLQEYLDSRGTATPPEVQAHLDVCSFCRERFRAARLCLDSWSKTPSPLPSVAFTQRVLSQVQQNRRRQVQQRRWLGLAAAVLLALTVGLMAWRVSKPVDRTTIAQPEVTPPQTPWQHWRSLSATLPAWDRQSWDKTLKEAAARFHRAADLLPRLEDSQWLPAHETLEASLVPAKAVKGVVAGSLEPISHHAQAAYVQLRQWWRERDSLGLPLVR
jgi:hypothetical protein